MDIKSRIEAAKANVRRAENARVVAQTQKENAEEQLRGVDSQMAEAGVTPETINDEIARLEAKLNDDLAKVERLIPTDI